MVGSSVTILVEEGIVMTEKIKYDELSERELFREVKMQYVSMERTKIKEGCYVAKDSEGMHYLLKCVDKFIGSEKVGFSDYRKWFLYWSFREKYYNDEEITFKRIDLLFNELAIVTCNDYSYKLGDIKRCIDIYWNIMAMLINGQVEGDLGVYLKDMGNVLKILRELFDVYMVKLGEIESISKDKNHSLVLDYLKDNL